MHDYLKGTKLLLLVAGIIEIAVGLLHFAMPTFVYTSAGFSSLTHVESNFVTLVIYAVGILLIAFGTVTILFSRHLERHLNLALYYVIIKTFLWSGRVILELLYPIKLNMFYIDPFAVIVLPGLIIELLLFVIITLQITKILKMKKSD